MSAIAKLKGLISEEDKSLPDSDNVVVLYVPTSILLARYSVKENVFMCKDGYQIPVSLVVGWVYFDDLKGTL